MRRKSYIAIRIAYEERYAIESYTTTVPIAKSRIFLLVFAETYIRASRRIIRD